MVTIGMNYHVRAGKEETFEKAFNKVVTAMGGMDGHGETHMFSDINDPQHYLIVSQWSSKVPFDAFIASDTFNNIATWGREQILSDRPRHDVYGEPESVDGGASSGVEHRPRANACPAGTH
ncbi:MAG: antibiotic biosynthesis monooxygenase [Gemmatimonadetes bacterium]|nr:antibiotic biosynthesis monooxygenase [Gemmatimonadota bacterium]